MMKDDPLERPIDVIKNLSPRDQNRLARHIMNTLAHSRLSDSVGDVMDKARHALLVEIQRRRAATN